MERREQNPINLALVSEIKQIVQGLSLDPVWGTQSGRFENTYTPNFLAEVGVTHKNLSDTSLRGFMHMPKDFKPPVYSINLYTLGEEGTLNTPYGQQYDFVLGADGNPYSFSNFYFFSEGGQAVKYEGVYSNIEEGQTTKQTLADVGLDPEKMIKLNFTPNERDSRYVSISGEDYLKIAHIVMSIKEGGFKPV